MLWCAQMSLRSDESLARSAGKSEQRTEIPDVLNVLEAVDSGTSGSWASGYVTRLFQLGDNSVLFSTNQRLGVRAVPTIESYRAGSVWIDGHGPVERRGLQIAIV